MPSSTVSLEPLSSPSPSPPPPELTIRDSHSNHSGAAAGLDSGSELSELTDDDQENDNAEDEDERPRPTRRKKRGGIVPAPMWDWAYKKADSGWRNKLIEEEEEEEQAGPAEAMEEEEDEGNDEDGTVDGDSPQMRPNLPLPDAPEDKEDEPEEDDVPEDEDDVPEGEDDQPTVHVLNNLDHDADPASDDDEAEPAVGTASRDTPPPRPAARLTSPELSDDENVDDEPVNTDAGIGEDEGQDAEPAADSDDEAEPNKPIPNGASTRQTPAPATASTTKVTTTTTVVTITKNPEPDASATPMDVDEDTPAPVVSPVAVVAAQSSLMAGADVVAPVSPSSASSSASGSPRGSPSPSRSPSAEPASDHEVDAKTTNGRMSIMAKATVSKVQNTRLTRTRSRRRTKGNTGFDQDEDTGRLGGEDDRDLADGDDVDIDSPDMELESDVLPVHRAEALDVLAQIELKFALLREKLYVEKMEGLAWEEALIAEDTHPEMLHLHTELDKRRNKRLDLAARRRDFEVANITKRRRLDEDGVWSWWKTARDDLQAEMTSETNRRRRKLDRERRNLDRPQPARVIPGPPLELSVPPTVYEIVKADPFCTGRSSKGKKQDMPSLHLVYPQLEPLSNGDIMRDLDFLYQSRAMSFDPSRQGMLGPGPMLGHPLGVPAGFDGYMGPLDGPALTRLGPPPPMQHLPHPHAQVAPGFAGPSHRVSNHIAPQPMPHPMMDIDSGIRRPSSVPGHPTHQPFTLPGPSAPINLMRRSISPMPAFTNGHGSGITGASSNSLSGARPQGWMAESAAGPSAHANSVKDTRRPHSGEHTGADRGKHRDRASDSRDRSDWERDERESYHLQHAPRHVAHTHAHTHVHGPAHNAHHHNGAHHHPYPRHHHVIHNHGVPDSGPGGGPGVNGSSMPNNMISPPMRELDLHRPRSGAPTEVIDLSSSAKQGPAMSAFWKGGEEQPMPGRERDRGRAGFGPPSLGPHERMVPPLFGMAAYPPSPRHGPSTAPGSRAPSRRGSFSAMEDSGPRPSSSHSLGPLVSGHQPLLDPSPTSHRQTLGNHGSRFQTSPVLPSRPSAIISPRANGTRLPPLSPSNASPMVGNMRSPIRMNQTLPPPPIPSSHSQSSSKPTSPVEVRRRTPPPALLQTRSPREPPHSSYPRTASPMIVLPPSSLPQSLPSRLPPVSLSEKHSPNMPKMKAQAVPIDGS